MVGRVGIADLGPDLESPGKLPVLCTCEDGLITGLDSLTLTEIGQGVQSGRGDCINGLR